MNARSQLTAWIKARHRHQKIKGTDEPYFEHLHTVAETAGPAFPLAYEIGLCHDLLEDTPTGSDELSQALIGFGYSAGDAKHITDATVELTDRFTKQAYPKLSKHSRKARETARLPLMSADAQTVKYADLMDNAQWVLKYEPKNARPYFEKKLRLLDAMDRGDATLRAQSISLFRQGLEQQSLKRKGRTADYYSTIFFGHKLSRGLLYTIAVILLICWTISVFAYAAGGFIHILLVLAVISFLLGAIRRA